MFRLEISTDNAAFGEDEHDDYAKADEVARILETLAAALQDSIGHLPAGGSVFDINGNTVGRWELNHE